MTPSKLSNIPNTSRGELHAGKLLHVFVVRQPHFAEDFAKDFVPGYSEVRLSDYECSFSLSKVNFELWDRRVAD